MSRNIIAAVLAVLLTGCQSPAETLPPPVPLAVQITPALEWLTPAMANCADQNPTGSLTVQEAAQANQSLDEADIMLRWSVGLPEEGQTFALGEDRLVIIVHPDNPLRELDGSQLAAVYAGSVPDWSSLSDRAAGTIQRWVFPAGDDAQMFFTSRVLPQDDIANTSRIAPDPAAMLSAVSADPLAIGLIPARWLEGSVKPITLTGVSNTDWAIPILAVTGSEPAGETRDWLLCVQETIQP